MQVHGMGVAVETSTHSAVSENRLRLAAHEFEGQLLQELLKPMASDALAGDGDGEDAGGVLGEFAAEALGRGLSERGGLGIANRLVAQLSQTGNAPVGYR